MGVSWVESPSALRRILKSSQAILMAQLGQRGTYRVRGYMILAVILQVLVSFLLILASKQVFSEFIHPVRAILGALVGGVYCSACAVPGLAFLNGIVWYAVSLSLTCLFSFGIGRETVKPAVMYCLLRTAMDGLAGARSQQQTLLWASIFCGVCLIGMWLCRYKRRYLPVELCWGEKKAKLQGLVDTGHSLRDPITGKQVLIVGADVAQMLTGFTSQQLAEPVENIGKIPGLRLIPYQSVGKSQGMLLALPVQSGKIGNRKTSVVVAFAPQVLDETGKFQALIGGTV